MKTVSALLLIGFAVFAAGNDYRSTSLDAKGQLSIKTESGAITKPPKLDGQVSFGQPAVAPDHRTVGWLVEYPYPGPPDSSENHSPISGALALYRAGHLIHLFHTDQIFWDWQFQSGGACVAYSTGPTHGGTNECVLRNVDSGKVQARWFPKEQPTPPKWAEHLRF